MKRRDLLKLMLATPMAGVVDFEKLLWVPKPIIVVQGLKEGQMHIDAMLTEISVQYMYGTPFIGWILPDGRKVEGHQRFVCEKVRRG